MITEAGVRLRYHALLYTLNVVALAVSASHSQALLGLSEPLTVGNGTVTSRITLTPCVLIKYLVELLEVRYSALLHMS